MCWGWKKREPVEELDGKGKSGSGGENNIHRRQKWRLWGASDAQRRKVPNPNAAESEDVVMSMTDKGQSRNREKKAPSTWS